jgi:hypothetical protein
MPTALDDTTKVVTNDYVEIEKTCNELKTVLGTENIITFDAFIDKYPIMLDMMHSLAKK